MRRSAVVALLLVSACGYRPGTMSVSGSYQGELRTIGCLDVAVEAAQDAEAVGPIARIKFGNRCDRPVVVDLAAIEATGTYPGGTKRALRLYDPRDEIAAGVLDARSAGVETIEYHDQLDDTAQPSQLCLDLARITPEEPSDRPVLACLESVALTTTAEVSP